MPDLSPEMVRDIGARLRELRDLKEIPPEEMARACGVPLSTYAAAEAGLADLPVGALNAAAGRLGVDLGLLLTGEVPRMDHVAITRRGQGPGVARRRDYGYESLTANFRKARFEPFAVTVPPGPPDAPVPENSHEGQEFDYVLEGRILLRLRGNDYVLEAGDSVIYDATEPHGMKALDDRPARFLAIITK